MSCGSLPVPLLCIVLSSSPLTPWLLGLPAPDFPVSFIKLALLLVSLLWNVTWALGVSKVSQVIITKICGQ